MFLKIICLSQNLFYSAPLHTLGRSRIGNINSDTTSSTARLSTKTSFDAPTGSSASAGVDAHVVLQLLGGGRSSIADVSTTRSNFTTRKYGQLIQNQQAHGNEVHDARVNVTLTVNHAFGVLEPRDPSSTLVVTLRLVSIFIFNNNNSNKNLYNY